MVLLELMILFTDSVLYLLLLVFPLYLWGENKDQLFFYLMTGFITGCLVYLLKIIFSVPRPIGALIETSTMAFPSLHAASGFFLLGFFFNKKRWRIPLLLYALLIAYSRVFLKVHYWSDVIVGSIIGFLVPVLIYQMAFLKKKEDSGKN